MLFKSPIFAQASGSIAGLTFSHNRGGMYVRSRVTPTDPATDLQVAVRTAMTALSVRWIETLTSGQRSAWTTYAANVEMTNRLGEAVFLTGQQHYVRANIPRLQDAQTPVDTGPTIFDLGAFTTPTIIATNAPNIEVNFEVTDPWVDETDSFMFVYASIEKSPTINYHKGPYRLLGGIDGDDSIPPISPQDFTPTTAQTQGNIVFVRARVSRVDGRLSGLIDHGSTVIGGA
jgi:hypothetical protein